MSNKSKYFAKEDSKKLVSYLELKGSSWYDSLYRNKYLDKIKKSWLSYHGEYYQESHSVSFGGESGELVNLPVNHYKNIATIILNMITASRPAFQAKSTNTDYKSQVQTTLANNLLDYYLREKRLEMYLAKAVEYAVVFGSGYVKMEWNATAGEIYDYVEPEEESIDRYDEEGNPLDENGEIIESFPIYEGDIEFKNLSPYDVVFDNTKESSSDHDWVLVRTFKNKYDIAAKYPNLKEKIEGLRTKSDDSKYRVSLSPLDETVDVAVYEFFHRRTESLPNGRYCVYLDSDVILMDTVMPYRRLPVYRVSPSEILGTPFGYTPMFDLLPMQDALNSLYSTILTNQNAFGVQNILNPRGNDVRLNQVEGALNFIEYNPSMGKPEALNLTQTPAEIFNFANILERSMETISGINSVSRGNPESSLKTGAALALVQSMSLQFINRFQQSYVMMIEDIGTGLIELLQDFAEVPRIAEIAGVSNKTKMKEFSGKDLNSIKRVIVDIGNALSQCLEKGTEVLMYDGSKKKVEDMKLGDLVMGPDSQVRTVNNVNSDVEMMYKVISKDKNLNISYGCNESHILTLRYCSDDFRYNVKKGQVIDITVRDFLKLPKRHQRLLQGFKVGVEFEEKSLNVPAYIMGLWLGDGRSSTPSLTTKDSEILNEWCNFAKTKNLKVRKCKSNNSGKASTYYITSGKQNGKSDRNSFMNELRSLELVNNKHIPNKYLVNSRKNRLELLAGLIDTDGTRNGETYIITQKSDKITKDIIYLSQSLGFKTTHKKRKQTPSKLVPNASGEINAVTIGGNTWEIPCRLSRKQCTKTTKQKNWLNYGIKIEKVKEDRYYGFTLFEEPHFLLGDFSVTHNTVAGKTQMADNMMQMGLITNPEDYLAVINTGKLERMTEGPMNHTLLVKAENERLVEGMPVVATAIDKHSYHIREHMNVLADPDLRFDQDLVKRVLDHVQEHISLSRTTDPDLLAFIGEQPLAPPGGSPVNPGNVAPDQMDPQTGALAGVAPDDLVPPMEKQNMPNMPGMPEMPVDPGTGESLLPSERGPIK